MTTPSAGDRYLLGIDTGSTYTDAVIYEEATRTVLASAKSPTTHSDLTTGIGKAVDRVIATTEIPTTRIDLVALSTTLATNALLEHTGRKACLVSIGFETGSLQRPGIDQALRDNKIIEIAGGHDAHGSEITPLDLKELTGLVHEVDPHVHAYAITARFSVRNPGHETAARDLIRAITERPVTCSHELSSRLDGPKRAVTALLNARLIPLSNDLMESVTTAMSERDITAPLFVMRGNGTVVSADLARERPIETVLSGPAASMVAGAHLSSHDTCLIADMGGTSTDAAVLHERQLEIATDGATVEGNKTMVESIRSQTRGLGGDSQIRIDSLGDQARLTVGPSRITPLAHFAMDNPALVHSTLDRQLSAGSPSDLDGMFLTVTESGHDTSGLNKTDSGIIKTLLTLGPSPLDQIAGSALKRAGIMRLVDRGSISLAGFTPTDANHVLGSQTNLDRRAARLGAELLARHRDRSGEPFASGPDDLAAKVQATVTRLTAEAVLSAALEHDGLPSAEAKGPIAMASLDIQERAISPQITRLNVGLSAPLVGIGASAALYFPGVAELLGTTVEIPEHADIAAALGCVMAPVEMATEAVITAPRRGLYRVHLGTNSESVHELEVAKHRAVELVTEKLSREMHSAGAHTFETSSEWSERTIEVEGRDMFVEAVLKVTATGRPDRR